MRKIVIICTLLSLCGCQNPSKSTHNSLSVETLNTAIPILEGTKWKCKITEGCIDYLYFLPDSNFVSYGCEADYKGYGKYYINKDTLYMHESAYDIDSLLSISDGYYGLGESMYKLVVKSGKLKYVEKWSFSKIKNIWTKDNFVFDENYLFERVR